MKIRRPEILGKRIFIIVREKNDGDFIVIKRKCNTLYFNEKGYCFIVDEFGISYNDGRCYLNEREANYDCEQAQSACDRLNGKGRR